MFGTAFAVFGVCLIPETILVIEQRTLEDAAPGPVPLLLHAFQILHPAVCSFSAKETGVCVVLEFWRHRIS